MQQSDAQLIQRVLQGDQDAFSSLVKKYQKGTHALAWRKIGDFHIAQEITQDAFLTAYQKLRTLKNHNAFAGWLYVIVANLSLDWLRKNRIPMESLDTADSSEVDKVSYSQYVAEKQEVEADETRREVVKELLKKLPESERTVMTLHYLGEMTIKAISEFIGVSPNTVKSRLSRARNRLKKEEDVIQQNLASFQLPANLAESIMQEVSRLAPIPPAVSKPVVPLAVSAVSAVLLFLLMGVGTQYLSRFQKPYSLDATSEATVELIEAVFVLDSPAKPAVRNQAGSSGTPGKSSGAGQQPDVSRFTTLPIDAAQVSTPKPQWTQTKGPEGGSVQNLFIAANGDLYAGADTHLYRLTNDGNAWRRVNSRTPIHGSRQMTEHGDTLYVVSDMEVFASADRGETWNPLGARPEGQLIDIVITDGPPEAQANIIMYLALVDGIFQSIDAGKSWISLEDKLADKKIRAITVIGNTLFVGTDAGLYRHNSEGWQRLLIDEGKNIQALASAEHRLYVALGEDVNAQISKSLSMRITLETPLSLYRSTDLGDSWQTLDLIIETGSSNGIGVSISGDTNDSETKRTSGTKIVAAQENVLLLYNGKNYYSNDLGETWVSLDLNTSDIGDASTLVSLNANTFYRTGRSGIYRTTDAGETWHQFNTGLVKTSVLNLVATHNRLYANIGRALVTSPDSGESWTPVPGNSENLIGVVKFNNTIYVRGIREMSPQLFRLSDENDELTPVPGMPILKVLDFNEMFSETIKLALLETVPDEAKRDVEAGKKINPEDFDASKFGEASNEIMEKIFTDAFQAFLGNFAVSDTAYFMESDQKLFRWKPGTTEWYETELIDESEPTFSFDYSDDLASSIGFGIAVSDSTVYVAKRNGHLFQSFDEGDTWHDVTVNLPFSVASFKAIAFAGTTVYVATDKGVVYSNDGTRWYLLTDAEGTPLVIEKFAVEDTTIYGTYEQQMYQLNANTNTWKQVTPEIPAPVTSLAVEGNVLYVGTTDSGVLRFTLDESD